MSAFATVDGAPVIDLKLTMPRVGVWVFEAGLDTDAPPAEGKRVAIEIGSQLSLSGSAEVSQARFGASVTRVRAGAGGLGKVCTPKHYKSVPLKLVLSDLLSTSGEQLDTTAEQAVLNAQLAQWTVLAQHVGPQLTRLLASQGTEVGWRFLENGKLWLGRERWSSKSPTFELLHQDPLNDSVVIFSADPLLVPGATFSGRRVSNVQHSLIEGRFRSRVWFE